MEAQSERWAEQLLIAEERLAEVYDILNELKGDLKDSGLKKDSGAVDEAARRIANYGRMFGELRESWSAPND